MTISYHHKPGEAESVIRFFRREADRLRSLAKIVVGPSRTVIHDINRDTMEFVGLGVGDPELEALLKELGVMYQAAMLQQAATEGREVEYPLSARFPWGRERVSG